MHFETSYVMYILLVQEIFCIHVGNGEGENNCKQAIWSAIQLYICKTNQECSSG